MIDEPAAGPARRPSILDIAYDRFHRVVALFCLYCGVLYWMRLVGVHVGYGWRFDLMPLHWQAAACALAVLFPFAAVGLWMVASWGPVIWFLCAAIEIVMYGFYPQFFGKKDWAITLHVAVGVVYLGFRLAFYLRRRRAAARAEGAAR